MSEIENFRHEFPPAALGCEEAVCALSDTAHNKNFFYAPQYFGGCSVLFRDGTILTRIETRVQRC